MADWMLPNSSTHSLFSSMLGENMGSTAVSESTCEGESGFSFHGSHEHHASTNPNYRNGPQDHHTGHVDDGTSRSWAMCEQQMMSSNGGGDLLERMASRGGFNAPILNTDTSGDFPQNWEALSPYLTIPSGLSPTTLLESPVFASDSLYNKTFNLDGLSSESADKNNENFFGSMDASSFAFRPTPDSGPGPGPGPNHFFGSSDNRAPFSSIEVSVESENTFPHQTSEHSKAITITRKDNGSGNMLEQRAIHTVGAEVEQFPLLVDEQQIQDEEADPRGAGYVIAPGEDGYNWRKYGQKQAKGSDSLQGYYKCSHSHCLVKKKVELSQEGHITEIIYKGSHNHPKPSPARRSSHIALNETQLRNGEHAAYTGGVGDLPEWRHDNPEGTSLGAEYSNGATTSLPVQNTSQFESGNVADRSSTFSNDEDDDERGTHGCVSVACDGDGDESESKKRKADMSINGASRAIKDPRVVVQTTSEVDILDDGYRWRKYGQKVVKGNPNPRSYYKCTSTGCAVRKHVERASHDLNSVITTYEGKHNHDIPAARNNNTHVSSDVPSNNAAVQHRPEHSQQLHNNMSQFQRATSFGSFGLPTGPHLIPPHDHLGYGMNQHSMPNMGLGVWGVNQAGQYIGQPRTMNEMVMPKGEPKVEPMCDSGLSLPNASAVYQQVMSRMPLGPQM